MGFGDHMLKSSQGTSTGRTCDGYEAIANQAIQIPPVAQSLKIQADSLEIRSIEFFVEKSKMEFSSLFQDEWWKTQILQLACAETSIRHALVALSMHHEQFTNRRAEIELQFAKRQQNLAIRELLLPNQQTLTYLHPMTCFIFICIEVRPSKPRSISCLPINVFRSYKGTTKPGSVSLCTAIKCFENYNNREHIEPLHTNLIFAPLCDIWRHHSIGWLFK